MSDNREQLWQAYVDGELSACEAAQFEATLTAEERERIAAEMRFERALGDRLRAGAECPEDVWARVHASVAPAAPRRSPALRRAVLAGAAIAAAALAVFALPEFYPLGLAGIFDRGVIHAAASVEDLASVSETEPGRQNVQKFLASKGIHLDVQAEAELMRALPFHRPIEVIGVHQTRFAGTRVTEVLVACCRKPVKLVLAPNSSRAARVLREAVGSGQTHVQSVQTTGEYTIAVVARHPANALTRLLSVEQ
jgi:hypothetical protein